MSGFFKELLLHHVKTSRFQENRINNNQDSGSQYIEECKDVFKEKVF